jgi:FkbM family methyltransferase
MPLVQSAARCVASFAGRNSAAIRALRPAYEAFLHTLHGGKGIPWQVNGVTYRIAPSERPRFGANYEHQTAAFLAKRIRPGMTCFDIGANVGAYVLQLAHWSAPRGRVVAFEPNAGARAVLAKHVEWNHLEDRVDVAPLAVAAEEGSQTLYAAGADGMSRLARANDALADSAMRVAVPVTTIDKYCARNGITPDVILLDIEGFEIEALRGARETISERRPIVVAEMHPNVWESAHTTREEAERLLKDLGLRAVGLSGQRDPLAEHGQVWLERT